MNRKLNKDLRWLTFLKDIFPASKSLDRQIADKMKKHERKVRAQKRHLKEVRK